MVSMILSISVILNALFVAAFIIVLHYMGPEGKHHLKMGVRPGGFSFITMDPGGALRLKRLKYNGDYFEDGDHAIFYNFDLLSNPQEDAEKRFNKMLERTAYWAGSRAPVLMGYEAVCFASNPHLIHALDQARGDEDFEGIEKVTTRVVEALKRHGGEANPTSRVSFIQRFDIPALREYVNAGTAAKQRISYEKGRVAGIMSIMKPKGIPSAAKWVIPIGLIILLLILWGTGFFDNVLPFGR